MPPSIATAAVLVDPFITLNRRRTSTAPIARTDYDRPLRLYYGTVGPFFCKVGNLGYCVPELHILCYVAYRCLWLLESDCTRLCKKHIVVVYLDYTYYINLLEDAYGC